MMINNPSQLVGLRQALYILRRLDEGQTREEIIKQFDGDEQIVDIWISFTIHNHWIKENNTGGWSITDKGRMWAVRKEYSEQTQQ